jgi:DNA-directed RNA polymerase specialized sigma24 family protein
VLVLSREHGRSHLFQAGMHLSDSKDSKDEKKYYGWAVDPEHPVLETVWLEAYALALFVAKSLVRNETRAEELRQAAFLNIRMVRRWNPEKRSFRSHVGCVVRSVFLDEFRKKQRSVGNSVPYTEGDERDPDEHNGDYRNGPHALDRLLDGDGEDAERRDLARSYLRVIRDEKLRPSDHVARGVIDCTLDKIDDVTEQAERLRVSIDQVRAARRRIRDHAENLHEEVLNGKREVG